MLSPEICFKARMSRDNRFDGKFYTAVMTTGIFCRPICPARAAKEENVRYFNNAASAQDAGFTPCKRCFPEHAPEQMLDIKTKRMSDIVLTSNDSIKTIAEQYGLSDRQFRRNFIELFGLAPKQYRLQHNLLLARKLLINTNMSMADICFASGYSSIRRFNEQIKQAYQLTPTQLRNKQGKPIEKTIPGVNIRLPYRPPFDWAAMLTFFKLRQLSGIEQVTDTYYQRTINIDGDTGWFKVTQIENEYALNLLLVLSDYKALNKVIIKIRKLFDLDADMDVIHQHLSQDPLLAPLVSKFSRVRLPGCWDILEFSIRAILGQQVSVKAATTLAGRIAEKYGSTLIDSLVSDIDCTINSHSKKNVSQQLNKCFPTLEELEGANFDNIGLTESRKQTLYTWLDFYRKQPNIFEHYQDVAALEKTLTALKGIGPWTVNYIAMRGLSDPNAFPAADLGVIKALAPDLTKDNEQPMTAVTAKTAAKFKVKDLNKRAETWQPWRAYATIYLWLSLSDEAI